MSDEEITWKTRKESCEASEQDIGFMVTNISYGIRGCFDRLFAGYDVTYPQSRVLTRLFGQLGKKDVNQRDLEHALGIKASSVSSLVRNLEEKGLVRCERSEQDTRNKIIILTEAGLELRDTLGVARTMVEKMLAQGMSEEEQELFQRCLRKVIANLETMEMADLDTLAGKE